MRRSTERILTTHCGSLPRPAEVVDVPAAIGEAVRRQLEVGLDIVNDGEMGKYSFTTYQYERLSGLGERDVARGKVIAAENADFPVFFERWPYLDGNAAMKRPACVGELSYVGLDAVRRDIAMLEDATAGSGAAEVFMSAISPATVIRGLANEHYAAQEEFEVAVADALKVEYDAIVAAGLLLQIDCPDFGVTPRYTGAAPAEHRRQVRRNVELLDHATRDIDPERMRLHVCWGADEAPHHRDVPLGDMLDLLLQARANGMTIVGANGRHEWEWRIWQDVELPEGKVIVPGVIDSTTNIIEHPETVADRLVRYASVLGRENVIGGVDCGLATVAGVDQVDPEIAWAKLAALADGARLASARLWR